MSALVATLVDRLVGRANTDAAVGARTYDRERGRAADYRLRSFPNEDVSFFVKTIDNSSVIRESDPQVPKTCWRMIAGAGAGAVLLIGLLLPSGYRMIAGFQLEELRKQNDLLRQQMVSLKVEEAKLVSPERLARLAEFQDLVDPDPANVIHIQTRPSAHAMAMSQEPKQTDQQ